MAAEKSKFRIEKTPEMDYRIDEEPDRYYLANDVTSERLEMAPDQFAENANHLRDLAALADATNAKQTARVNLTSDSTVQIFGDSNELYALARRFEGLASRYRY